MAFIEPMHHNKPNITYLLITQDAQTEKMKLLLTVFELVIHD